MPVSHVLALCLVGELRDHFEGGIAGAIRNSFLNHPQWRVDVFVDTALPLESTPTVLARIAEAYGDNLALVHVERDPSNVSLALDTVVLPDEVRRREPAYHRSTLPNFQRMHRCDNARRRHERSTGCRYDAVIKMRPDSKFCKPLRGKLGPEFVAAVESVLERRVDFSQAISSIQPLIQVSDKYAVGTSRAMDIYMNIFPDLSAIWANMSHNWTLFQNQLVGERLLHYYMGLKASFGFQNHFVPCGRKYRGHKGKTLAGAQRRRRRRDAMRRHRRRHPPRQFFNATNLAGGNTTLIPTMMLTPQPTTVS